MQAKVDQTFKVVYNLTAYGTKKHTIPDPLAPFLNGGEFAINKQSYTGMPIHCARKVPSAHAARATASNRPYDLAAARRGGSSRRSNGGIEEDLIWSGG